MLQSMGSQRVRNSLVTEQQHDKKGEMHADPSLHRPLLQTPMHHHYSEPVLHSDFQCKQCVQ